MVLSENFNIQAGTVIEFNQFLHGKPYNNEERESLGICLQELLYELLERWSTYNFTKHLWKNALPEDFGHIVFIHAHNEINDARLQILINKEGFFLEMSIASPENLPKMSDNFWMEWLGLHKFGDLEVIEYESFSDNDKKSHPELFPNKTSNLFLLMRRIIAFPIIYDGPIECQNLSINWPFEKYSIKEVFEKGCLAFERLCYLNNRLISEDI